MPTSRCPTLGGKVKERLVEVYTVYYLLWNFGYFGKKKIALVESQVPPTDEEIWSWWRRSTFDAGEVLSGIKIHTDIDYQHGPGENYLLDFGWAPLQPELVYVAGDKVSG